ncbi:MAG: GntR family transcriptional regulator [Tepidimonas sp.]|uniref:GntR family transcriptional regulator n=1 Tax=Tepidimonas sp. TaxID=2002775 RepID=UPI00298F2299|nr:GntR family transcriptional regulator [Tepidimonas sp.]MCS6811879.1 GntR family transcriptional regulator [Tepidimonas sp.]MCX7742507.1 GntR family transcriptional regulator [Tepidimonas sp.]MDW8335734.1 GntR family transcriptional regulator [Tepidimonas sp.]
MPGMTATPTRSIVEAITRAIVEQRLLPGAKLGEQRLAAHFGVSRTLVRQALHQLAQRRLVRLEPARGAFVASPSVREAREVFAVRRTLERALAHDLAQTLTAPQLRALRQHVRREAAALARHDVPARTQLLGDFHVLLARCSGNQVLAELLEDLLARCALVTLMYQSAHAAAHSHTEHEAIVAALAARDAERAAQLLDEHLQHVEQGLALDRPVPCPDVTHVLRELQA